MRKLLFLLPFLWNVALADTLTVYPDAGTGGTTTDAYLQRTSQTTWANARDTADAISVNSSGFLFTRAAKFSASNFAVQRSGLTFDTSSIDDTATISAATISVSGAGGTATSADTSDIYIVSFAPASDNSLVVGDYDTFGTSQQGSLAISSYVDTDGTYNDISFSSFTEISKTGISKLGLRVSNDASNTEPTGENVILSYSSDQTGTTNDPKLVVTYTVSTFSPKIMILQ